MRFRTHEWTREKDRALIAEGWDRFRPGGHDEGVIACGVPAATDVIARAQVLKVLGVQSHDVVAVGPDPRQV